MADPLYTLLFEGLWLLADREGRLEDRPLRIKAEIFPYREGLDIESMLNWLVAQGFITRYTSGGVKCVFIVEFKKHQNPHKNEPESSLPSPEFSEPDSVINGCTSEYLGKTSEKIGSAPADSLIPDSGFLIPDNSPDGEFVASEAGNLSHQRPKLTKPQCPHQEIIALYHELLPANPSIRDWTPARAEHLRVRWNEDAKRQTLDWWGRFFEYIAQSEFLTGRSTGKDRKPFTPGLDWIVKAENFAKIREGRFHDPEAA
ncbi:hypothetical protein [Pandoraea iniqua]|uniref:hypothetical protein n=1 Tax=Pandoraea iniqua TaxID=2508288 RepID=UPI001FE63FC4|nr:hypothetical protein [Pandoraea iniqua]